MDTDFWGPPISVYTREQAIEDGLLVEVPEAIARAEGFMIPVVITLGVHVAIEAGNGDYTARLRDVLGMARIYSRAKRQSGDSSPTVYPVIIGSRTFRMVLRFSPFDGFTITLPGED